MNIMSTTPMVVCAFDSHTTTPISQMSDRAVGAVGSRGRRSRLPCVSWMCNPRIAGRDYVCTHTNYYQHVGARNTTNGKVTLRAYMKTALAGKMINQHSRWANRTRIKDLITTVQQTRPIEISTMMMIANDHQQHTNIIKITTHDLTMIVEDHHHMIARTLKCAVRAAQAAAT
jgi:hypothetical protein